MAIRKDLDDMLNNLRGSNPEKASSKAEPPKAKSIYDSMSVDDLLNALTVEKKPSLAENIINELDEKESRAAEEAAPPVPETPAEESAPKQKRKVVITGELPDYEELRRQEEEQKRQERLRAENRRMNVPAVNPEPKPETVPEPEVTPEPETVPEPEITPEPETVPEPEVIPEPEIVPEPEKAPEEIEYDKEQEKQSAKKKKKSKRNKKRKDEKPEISESAADEIAEVKTDDLFNGDSVENEAGQTADSDTGESATDLIEAALAAINGTSDTPAPTDGEAADGEKLSDTQTDSGEEAEEQNDGVSSLIEDIREDAANAIAEIEEGKDGAEESGESGEEEKSAEDEKPEEETAAEDEKSPKKGKITSVLTKILDEDPETLIDVKRENPEDDDEENPPKKKKLKKRIYAIFGVIFTVFAIIGIITTVSKGVDKIRGFATGEAKKDGFTELIYPVVIMDIESFDKPADLTSEQIITASIWSIIMDDEKLEKYPVNVAGGDVISISAYDVESEAVALFGQNHAAFEHTTVGPMTSRFYYDAEKGVYNVPVHPIVFTYEPEIKSIEKSGSDYKITVDYIDERPAWMEKSVSKSVEFHVTEKGDGTYQFTSMKILYVKNNL